MGRECRLGSEEGGTKGEEEIGERERAEESLRSTIGKNT